MTYYLIPLLLTVIIELIVVKVIMPKEKIFINVLLVNLLTNPALNIFVRWLVINSYENIWPIIIVLEILIFVFEGIFYKFLFSTNYKKGILTSFLANGISFLFSFII